MVEKKTKRVRCSVIVSKEQDKPGARCRRLASHKILLTSGEETSVVVLCPHHAELLDTMKLVVIDDAFDMWIVGGLTSPKPQ